jgi:hypothetical protein
MRFSEILFVHERHGRVEQSATSAAPAHAVVDDEPAQMGDTRPQVFPIDGKGSDNPPILDGEPDFVAGLLEAIAKFGEAPCDDGLEALTESGRARIIERVHLGYARDQSRPISRDNVERRSERLLVARAAP